LRVKVRIKSDKRLLLGTTHRIRMNGALVSSPQTSPSGPSMRSACLPWADEPIVGVAVAPHFEQHARWGFSSDRFPAAEIVRIAGYLIHHSSIERVKQPMGEFSWWRHKAGRFIPKGNRSRRPGENPRQITRSCYRCMTAARRLTHPNSQPREVRTSHPRLPDISVRANATESVGSVREPRIAGSGECVNFP